ncbi:hypothetical protein Tco_0173314 [Tanacetum coccineum]
MWIISRGVVLFIYFVRSSRDIRSDKKCRIAWSESDSIQNDLKCGFSWCQSARDSSISFSDIKSIFLRNKLKIKLGLLSSDERHYYAFSVNEDGTSS